MIYPKTEQSRLTVHRIAEDIPYRLPSRCRTYAGHMTTSEDEQEDLKREDSSRSNAHFNWLSPAAATTGAEDDIPYPSYLVRLKGASGVAGLLPEQLSKPDRLRQRHQRQLAQLSIVNELQNKDRLMWINELKKWINLSNEELEFLKMSKTATLHELGSLKHFASKLRHSDRVNLVRDIRHFIRKNSVSHSTRKIMPTNSAVHYRRQTTGTRLPNTVNQTRISSKAVGGSDRNNSQQVPIKSKISKEIPRNVTLSETVAASQSGEASRKSIELYDLAIITETNSRHTTETSTSSHNPFSEISQISRDSTTEPTIPDKDSFHGAFLANSKEKTEDTIAELDLDKDAAQLTQESMLDLTIKATNDHFEEPHSQFNASETVQKLFPDKRATSAAIPTSTQPIRRGHKSGNSKTTVITSQSRPADHHNSPVSVVLVSMSPTQQPRASSGEVSIGGCQDPLQQPEEDTPDLVIAYLPQLPQSSPMQPSTLPLLRKVQRRNTRINMIQEQTQRWGQKQWERSLWNELERERLEEELKLRQQQRQRHDQARISTEGELASDAPRFESYGFLAKYCILEKRNISMYRATFDVCDEEGKLWLTSSELIMALRGVNPDLQDADLDYINLVMKMCDYDTKDGADFQLFSVLAALTERIIELQEWIRVRFEKINFKTLAKSIYFFKQLWESIVDPMTKYLPLSRLCVELKAGGVTRAHIEEVQDRLESIQKLNLIDYLIYIPLFLLMHNSIIEDPFDTSERL